MPYRLIIENAAGSHARSRRLRLLDATGEVSWERITSVAVVKATGLEAGRVFNDSSSLDAAIDADEERLCNERALVLLAYRSRSIAEMYERLTEDGYPADLVDRAVTRLVDIGYLDDAEFAAQFVRSKQASGWGFRKIRDGLARKGIAEDAIEDLREESFSTDDEVERARRLIARLDLNDRKGRDRAIRRLLSKGFPPDIAISAVRSAAAESDADSSPF